MTTTNFIILDILVCLAILAIIFIIRLYRQKKNRQQEEIYKAYLEAEKQKRVYKQKTHKFLETLTTYQNSIKVINVGTNKAQLDNQTFSIETYFSIFSALNLCESYKLGVYYQTNRPVIYVYHSEEEELIKHLQERKIKNEQETILLNDSILRLSINPLSIFEVPDTKEGYFQYLVFYLLGNKFALYGDSCYDNIKILWNVDQIKGLSKWGRTNEEYIFRTIFQGSRLYVDNFPKIELNDKFCIIDLLEAKGSGEWMELNRYQISRKSPHTISMKRMFNQIYGYYGIFGYYENVTYSYPRFEEILCTPFTQYTKVIFLDIDGVIRHNGSLLYLDYDLSDLAYNLTQQYKTNYQQYSKEELGVVYYDWDREAIERLKHIVQQTGAKIVITSTWREQGLQRLIDFFRLYGLENVIIGMTDKLNSKDKDIISNHKYYNVRTLEILKYLHNHPEIESYVAIDDMDISKGIEDNFLQTKELLSDEDCSICIDILQDN